MANRILLVEDEETLRVSVARGLSRLPGVEVVAVGTDLYGIAPVADAVAAIGPFAAGDAVLVKGSRVAGLERVALALAGEQPPATGAS